MGASDGTTSLIQLDESLATCSKLDRTNANDMFDRWVGDKRVLGQASFGIVLRKFCVCVFQGNQAGENIVQQREGSQGGGETESHGGQDSGV